MRYIATLLLSLFIFTPSYSYYPQETYMYRLYLKDKGNPPFSIDNPEEFLSWKSIERRMKQGYTINESDLPIDPGYLDAISRTGAKIQTYSKWVNTVVVRLTNKTILSRLESLEFMDSLECVWTGTYPRSSRALKVEFSNDFQNSLNDINQFGRGFSQIAIHNGHLLHDSGFRGKNISIAVMDGGFFNADQIDFFDQDRIIEVKNFSHTDEDPLRNNASHGTKVLSCMLANKPGEFIGTAPLADYYIFQTEIVGSEYPVEEDYWIAALEYADSIGVDIITTSLGYNLFDDSEMDHDISELDGKTIPASRAAGMAASKGLLVFHAAGNEGNNSWEKIMAPADAENILTIGSITADSVRSAFSSVGFTADGRIKPDLMSMGTGTTLVNEYGALISSNGTSYATPVLAGLGACLWEALPELTNTEIMDLLIKAGSNYQNPDSLIGYGIPDVYEAYNQIRTGIDPLFQDSEYLTVSSIGNYLYVNSGTESYNISVMTIYSGLGALILRVNNFDNSIDISRLPKGVYVAYIQLDNRRIVRKFIKT